MEKQPRHVEWGRLLLSGKPVLAGAAIGTSRLLWVACRASPFLVHIFQDTKLVKIWRFAADPMFLLLGDVGTSQGEDSDGEILAKNVLRSETNNAALIVITADGRVWHLHLSSDLASTARRGKKRKESISREPRTTAEENALNRDLGKPSDSSGLNDPKVLSDVEEWDLFEDIDVYSGKHVFSSYRGAPVKNTAGSKPAHHKTNNAVKVDGEVVAEDESDIQGVTLQYTKLSMQTHPRERSKLEVTPVLHEALLGIVPSACVAAFGPNASVVVLDACGACSIFNLKVSCPARVISLSVCQGISAADGAALAGAKPTSLLLVSVMGTRSMCTLNGRNARLHQKLFYCMFMQQGGEVPLHHGLLRGDNDGRVYAIPLKEAEGDIPSPTLLCDIQEPVVELLVVPSQAASVQFRNQAGPLKSVEGFKGDYLLIVGQLGRLLLITGVQEPSKDSTENLFLPCTKIPSWTKRNSNLASVKLNERNLTLCEWKLNSYIMSACMVGPHRLCYTDRSEIFFADLFDIVGVSSIYGKPARAPATSTALVDQDLFGSRPSIHRQVVNSKVSKDDWILRDELVSRVLPVSDQVIAIAGKGFAGGLLSTRPLVALSTRGRLLGVELSDLVSGPSFNCDGNGPKSWGVLQARMQNKLQELLQTVTKVSQSAVEVKKHSLSIMLALNELATALPLAQEISADQSRLVVYSPNSEEVPAGKLWCTLAVIPRPSIFISPAKLSFRPKMHQVPASKSSFSCCRIKVVVSLYNSSSYMLSQYWSLLLELHCLSPNCTQSVHYSTVINNGMGLPIGSQDSHEFDLELPGKSWEPVMASVYLCHIHDHHHSISECTLEKINLPKSFFQTVCSDLISEDLLSGKSASIRKDEDSKVKDLKSTSDLSDIENSPKVGAVCILLSRYRIDLFSLCKPPSPQLGITPWTHLDTGQRSLNERSVGDDTLCQPFSGKFTVTITDSSTQADTDYKALWQKLHLSDLYKRGAVSKAARRVVLSEPDGGTILVSLEMSAVGENLSSISVLFQSSNFVLGSLARESLLWRLTTCKENLVSMEGISPDELKGYPSTVATEKIPRTEFSGGFAEDIPCQTTKPAIAKDSVRLVDENLKGKDYVEALARQVTAMINKWSSVLSSKMSEDIGPLLDDTYGVIQAVLKVYKLYREGSSSNPFLLAGRMSSMEYRH